jgi:RimJ/RimL family protein N-acetyltransferase
VPSLFVLGASGCAVGSGGFKGEPSNGRVEIGYGVAEILRGCGFATEGARQLVHFAFDQPGITEVYAESATDNIASRRVLQKAGFVRTGQRDTEDDGPVEQWLVRNDDRRPPS